MLNRRSPAYQLVVLLFAAGLAATNPCGHGKPSPLPVNDSRINPPLEVREMYQNKDPAGDPGISKNQPSRFYALGTDDELLWLRREIRRLNLDHNDFVRWLETLSAIRGHKNGIWARQKLRMIIEAEQIEIVLTGDVYRPLAPPTLLSQGDILFIVQVDGSPWLLPLRSLTRGTVLAGPQGGGKSMLVVSLCRQLSELSPPIPFFILDPKLGLRDWADYLNATYVMIEDIGFDLSPPPGLTYETWFCSLAPQLGEILGVVYGVELLQDLATVCIELRNRYIQTSGNTTEICLQDWHEAIPMLKGVSAGRRAGYRDAVATGLNRILSGSGDLFKCRKGVDLSTLFNHNVILGCRSITDEFAARFLAFYLLFYLYESERYSPLSDKLKRVLIFDDATRFLAARSRFEGHDGPSSLTHIYSVLRSSGNGVVAVSQIPHMLDPGILALSHTIACVGALHHVDDLKALGGMMALTEQQRMGITRLASRECIGMCAGSAWSGIVHGITPDVPDVRSLHHG
jgi:hypothetical protein